jgi:hypothetical protein
MSFPLFENFGSTVALENLWLMDTVIFVWHLIMARGGLAFTVFQV